ncbi:hypothetical protein AKJ09_05416 [Labilithrix luteola]|uniref:IgGFc-binding protein N-terminal domain-containing protein n=1 Tax=Labilithrix luteola TaxID=1391654 RepID=A0A0K1PZ42_9BACT|nr:IgGFc-binding protein [Labilithrix luteola]AKU98752.1 hypothetical protein AKJ09_05416 [Labilithrix luteola]
MKPGTYAVVVGGVALAAVVACGKGDRNPFADERRGFDISSDAAPPGCKAAQVCSRDLRAIVDFCDESHVFKECPPDQGCADGACVPACEATAINTSSAGCEFAALPPSLYLESGGSCFAAIVTNTWAAPARIEADYAGVPIDLATSARVLRSTGDGTTYEPFTGELQPRDMAVVFLSHSPERPPKTDLWVPCPDGITPAMLKETGVDGTRRAQSFRIKTSAPVNTYTMYPFGGAKSYAPSATLVLPVAAWKNEYIVTSPWERSLAYPAAPTTQLVAAEDDTEVTLIPSTNVAGGPGVDGADKGVPQKYRMNRGEVIQFNQGTELSGSRISSTKQVAVFGGHQCMFIPAGQYACDTTQLQLFPVHSWGHEYAAVPHLSRRADGAPEEYFYRIVAAADDTVLTYDPAPPEDAPTKLASAGSGLFTTRDPFVVRSQDAQHPIAVYAYMSGLEFSGAAKDDGDPEITYVIPTEQYLGNYVFFADRSFRNTHLVVVRSRSEGRDFQPVSLDCAGTLEGWKPVGTDGKHEFVRVSLKKDGLDQHVGSGTCTAGRHEMNSTGPFTVTVWGTDAAASYAYPGGAALRKLNDIEPSKIN